MSVDFGFLTFVCLVLTVLTVRAAYRLARRRAALALTGIGAVALWGGLLAVAGYYEVRHHVTQTVATAATRELSGDPGATVVCRRVHAEPVNGLRNSGFVSWDDPDTAILSQPTCAALGAWLFGGRGHRDVDQVTAVHVVAHEAGHVAGLRDEATTECFALANTARAARLMGATHAKADAVAHVYARAVHPHLSEEYRTDCSTVDTPAHHDR